MIALLLYKAVLVVVIFGITLFIAAYSTYAERKVAAFLQDRVGPDRAGPFGILQPLADGLKFIMKEEIIQETETVIQQEKPGTDFYGSLFTLN